jgi:catechol 2,3-dioxygenase-like lactoylglutathione lyase family enzyme
MEKDFGIRLEHAGINVRNMQETIEWYHEMMGFELVTPSFDEFYHFRGGVFPKCCTMRLGNFELEIYETPEALPFNFIDFEWNLGLKHLSFEIADIHGWVEFVKKKGVTIVVENYYDEYGVTFYLLDNSGILIECTDVRKKPPLFKDRDAQ